jgi:uroporphyrinogen-III synthase
MPEPAVWITRPSPAAAKTGGALRAQGFPVLEASVLEVTITPADPVPAGPWPDWIIFVSANAVRGFAAACRDHTFPPRLNSSPRIAAVGRVTAEVARAHGLAADVVPDDQQASGVIHALSDHTLGRVWIPAGNRPGSANHELPSVLGARGAHVEVFRVYQTVDRELTPIEIERLGAATPGAIVTHSPSAAQAIYGRAVVPPAVKRWRRDATAVAIGPKTRAVLNELSVPHVIEAPEPTDAGVAAVLATLPCFAEIRRRS